MPAASAVVGVGAAVVAALAAAVMAAYARPLRRSSRSQLHRQGGEVLLQRCGRSSCLRQAAQAAAAPPAGVGCSGASDALIGDKEAPSLTIDGTPPTAGG
eukprot:7383866-Prymnesium_polylepis.4